MIDSSTIPPWCPSRVLRVIRAFGTSTAPIRVATDRGEAFVKTLGNPEGPDALVSEWIGTALAKWLGLPMFEVALVHYPEELGVRYPKGCRSLAGPAFAARAVPGRSWSGTKDDLDLIDNPADISGLVLLDTWTRNYDRYSDRGDAVRRNVGNVFFCDYGARPGRYRLLAIDQSECFRTGRALTSQGLLDIDNIRDVTIYGLFPEFRQHVTRDSMRPFLNRLATFQASDFDRAAAGVPNAWGLRRETLAKLKTFCLDRSRFLLDSAEKILEDICNWTPVLPLPESR